jgi:hypothetical protein
MSYRKKPYSAHIKEMAKVGVKFSSQKPRGN